MLTNKNCVLFWSLIVIFASAAVGYPAEDKSTTTTTTTTEKPVRHPDYVRLLNRKKKEDGTESGKKNSTPDDALATLASGKNLTAEEIKNIVPYLDFTTEPSSVTRSSRPETPRPRGLSGLLNIFRAPLNALRGFGDRNKTPAPSVLTRSDRNSTSTSTSNKNSSSPASNSILAGPGRLLAGFMKVMQSMSLTFGQMMDSLFKLFNFGGGRNRS